MSKYRDDILKLVVKEPRTPNEIAEKLGIHQSTAQNILKDLAMEGRVKHKKVGRVHLFWKE